MRTLMSCRTRRPPSEVTWEVKWLSWAWCTSMFGDVECLVAFQLRLVVLDTGAGLQHDFAHRVVEASRAGPGIEVVLHHARAARDLRDEQHSGVGNDIGLAAGRDEDEVNGVSGRGAAPKVNEGAVLDECGVERRECEVSAVRVAPEMILEGLGGILERLAQPHHEDSFPYVLQGGLRPATACPSTKTSRQHSGAAGPANSSTVSIRTSSAVGEAGTKERFLERGKPGVLPVLVPGGWESRGLRSARWRRPGPARAIADHDPAACRGPS